MAVTEPTHQFSPLPDAQLGHIGLYASYVANMDAGWTQWLFDRYGIPYKVLHDSDTRGDSGEVRWSFRMNGWEAGIRTPIRRSRVYLGLLIPKQINDLTRQIPAKSGKIRNTAAIQLPQ